MTASFVRNLVGTSVHPPIAEIGGTDLGIFWDIGDGEFGSLCGDSFQGGPPGSAGWWRSPVLLRSRTTNLDAGITFTGAVGGASAREIVPNAHQAPYVGEVSKIPNDAFRIGNRQYMSVMSVNNWEHGTWETNYAELHYSDDRGETWHPAGIRWTNNGNHTDVWQMQSWVVDGGYAYLFATSNGRHLFDGIYLSRVPLDHIADRSAYQAWGYRREWWQLWGSWAWGNPASPILSGIFGEPSVRKVENRWVFSVAQAMFNGIVTRTAATPDTPWTAPKVQVSGAQWPQCYGGFIHPASTLNDLHLSVSQWNTTTGNPYHVMQFRGSAL